ncbi:MAG: metallophosphoesterase family protein [Synechococcus sp.]
MPRLLHTADWQIGKPYRWIDNPERRSRLQRARIDAVERLIELSQQRAVDAIVVAGDLFDSSAVDRSLVMEVLELIGSITTPVLVIPGNHDHGGAGGLWRRSDVQEDIHQRATNLQLLHQPEPFGIAGFTVLPCPLRRQHETVSPGAWLDTLDWNNLDATQARVVLAHGSIQGFSAMDYDHSTPAECNHLHPSRWNSEAYDYLALGDWHALKPVPPKGWYAGTPEPDRFSTHAEEQRGQVLIADVERGQTPVVETVTTATMRWHNERIQLRSSHDLERLQQRITTLTNRRVGRDLLRLEIDGQLGLEDHQLLEQILDQLRTRLLHLRVRGQCHRRPETAELSKLLNRADAPLMGSIARQLQQALSQTPADQPNQIALLETALCELHRLSAVPNTAPPATDHQGIAG